MRLSKSGPKIHQILKICFIHRFDLSRSVWLLIATCWRGLDEYIRDERAFHVFRLKTTTKQQTK